MQVLLGGGLGYLVGLVAWLVACWFASRYRTGPSPDHPPQAGPFLRGIKGAISLPAALTQAGLALWGIYVGWQAPAPAQVVAALLVTGFLLAICLVDFQTRRIPNLLLLILLIWTAVQILWLRQPTLQASALGLLVGGGLFFLLALLGRGALGAGDVKLAATVGALLGYPLVFAGLVSGALAGGVAALVLLATRRAGRKDTMAYGPYLALGAWIVWTWSMGLWP